MTANYIDRERMMEEITYLQAGTSLVTSSRIEIDGQTFAVRNVGSVKIVGGGHPWAGALLLVVGAMALTANPFFGLPLLALGAYMVWQKLALKTLVLISGGGETVALKSTNAKAIEALRVAIAQAISAR